MRILKEIARPEHAAVIGCVGTLRPAPRTEIIAIVRLIAALAHKEFLRDRNQRPVVIIGHDEYIIERRLLHQQAAQIEIARCMVFRQRFAFQQLFIREEIQTDPPLPFALQLRDIPLRADHQQALNKRHIHIEIGQRPQQIVIARSQNDHLRDAQISREIPLRTVAGFQRSRHLCGSGIPCPRTVCGDFRAFFLIRFFICCQTVNRSKQRIHTRMIEIIRETAADFAQHRNIRRQHRRPVHICFHDRQAEALIFRRECNCQRIAVKRLNGRIRRALRKEKVFILFRMFRHFFRKFVHIPADAAGKYDLDAALCELRNRIQQQPVVFPRFDRADHQQIAVLRKLLQQFLIGIIGIGRFFRKICAERHNRAFRRPELQAFAERMQRSFCRLRIADNMIGILQNGRHPRKELPHCLLMEILWIGHGDQVIKMRYDRHGARFQLREQPAAVHRHIPCAVDIKKDRTGRNILRRQDLRSARAVGAAGFLRIIAGKGIMRQNAPGCLGRQRAEQRHGNALILKHPQNDLLCYALDTGRERRQAKTRQINVDSCHSHYSFPAIFFASFCRKRGIF